MGLETISGKSYHNSTAYSQQIKNDAYAKQDAGTDKLNIQEQISIANTGNSKQGNDPAVSQDNKSASGKQIQDAISKANNTLKEHRTRCEFSYHEETNRVSIKVIDRDTDKVIREIPPEESLKILEKVWELAGILVDEKR